MIVVSISANNIHAKQLAPHLRQKIKGKDAGLTYQETVSDESGNKGTFFVGIAGEPLKEGKFGHFQDDKIILASSFNKKPANCLIVSGAEEGGTVKYVVGEHIVEVSESLARSPYLGEDGNLTQTLPTSGIIQVLGDKITDTSFMLSMKEPLWW